MLFKDDYLQTCIPSTFRAYSESDREPDKLECGTNRRPINWISIVSTDKTDKTELNDLHLAW